MYPSIGRVVIYAHAGSADGRYPPMESPAIVQAASGDRCDLFVMSATGGIFFAKDIPEQKHEEGSSWKWPKRV